MTKLVVRNTTVVALLGLLVLPFIKAETKLVTKPSEAELAVVTQRGVLLAEYDAAAWQATDALTASHPIERTNLYIARKTAAGWIIDFGRLNEARDKFLLTYEVLQTAYQKFDVKSFDLVKEDTGWNLAAAKGIEAAKRDFGETSRPYNVAVLPAEGGGMYVYLYPAQLKAGVYPLGADVRYHVSPDGTRIIEKRQMHKTIIESVTARSDITVEVGYHTHILSEVPEDTDVFLVLTRQPRVPEVVIAGPYMFTIYVNGKMTVEDRPR